jgi:hypothetical protein
MQKIMFNKPYGLQHAVECGYKTMTRRPVGKRMTEDDIRAYLKGYTELANKCAQYKIGEVVAVAQPYKVLDYSFHGFATNPSRSCGIRKECAEKQKGWGNKMFVESKFMPHQIRITDIKVERLQDISDDDCLKEGLIKEPHPFVREAGWVYCMPNDSMCYVYPTQCFADFIDGVSGKGTWESNPWVFAYSFNLVK